MVLIPWIYSMYERLADLRSGNIFVLIPNICGEVAILRELFIHRVAFASWLHTFSCCICFMSIARFLSLHLLFWNQTHDPWRQSCHFNHLLLHESVWPTVGSITGHKLSFYKIIDLLYTAMIVIQLNYIILESMSYSVKNCKKIYI